MEIQQLREEKEAQLRSIAELKEQMDYIFQQNKVYECQYVHTGLECEFCYTTLQIEFDYCPKCGKKIVKNKKLENIKTNNNIFQTEEDGDCLLITQYNGFNNKQIIIPSSINGKPIIGIWNNVFEKCTELEEVVFEEGCRYIGKYAFANCYNLKKVKLPKSLLEIGDLAFSYSGIQAIALPPNVKVIGAYAFSNTKLKKIILPDKLRCISNSMLADTLLEEIDIPQSVTHIENFAFKNTNIKEIELPRNLYSIGERAFEISGLKEITIHSNVQIVEKNIFGAPWDKVSPVVYCAAGSKGHLYARKYGLTCKEIPAQPDMNVQICANSLAVHTACWKWDEHISSFHRYCGIYKAETWSWKTGYRNEMLIEKDMDMDDALRIKDAMKTFHTIHVKQVPGGEKCILKRIEISECWGVPVV